MPPLKCAGATSAPSSSTPPILIVGAGPAGLSTAWALLRAGTPPASIRLIDGRPNPIDGHDSRALGINARTLEVLGPTLGGRLVAAGKPLTAFAMNDGAGRPLIEMLMDGMVGLTDFPFVLALSQGAAEVEMRGALAERGVTPEWGVLFGGLEGEGEGEASGEARLLKGARTPQETQELAPFTFLVGCDGINSAVRSAAGIPVAQSARPSFSFLADVELAGDGRDAVLSRPHAFLGSGLALSIPLERPGWTRLVFDGPPVAETGGARPTLDGAGVQSLFVKTMPFAAGWTGGGGGGKSGGDHSPPPSPLAATNLTIATIGWTSAFRVVEHIAPTFRAGRVFLAGDAAHAHSPVGGQGLNLGVQDGANLGWKLGLVSGGGVRGDRVRERRILDSYSAERRPVAAVRVRSTGLAWRVLVETKAAALVALRNGLIRLVGSSPARAAWLARSVGPALGMLTVAYPPDGTVVCGGGGKWAKGAPGPGARAPLAVGGLAARLEGAEPRHLLVAWGGRAALPLTWAAAWTDPPPALVSALGGEPATPGAVVIRPDGVVGWRGEGVEGAAAWWARLVGE